jgi:glutathione peroxidase
MNSVHQFELTDIDGKPMPLSQFKGKKLLIVNTASQCGYTPQYEGLQKLADTYEDKVQVLGIPCNDFGGQEPDTEAEIKEFCSINFGIKFPMSSKQVILGEDKSPLYAWLTQASQNGVMDSEVKWNFTKYLVDEEGRLMKQFLYKTDPLSEEVTSSL